MRHFAKISCKRLAKEVVCDEQNVGNHIPVGDDCRVTNYSNVNRLLLAAPGQVRGAACPRMIGRTVRSELRARPLAGE